MTWIAAWRTALAAIALLVFYWAVLARSPLITPLPDAVWLAAPTPARTAALLKALGGLTLINLAAWGMGTSLGRRFPLGPVPGVRALASLGLGMIVLSLAVLGLAALHAAEAQALAAVLAGGAAIGLLNLARSARPRRPTGRECALVLGGALLLASPLLAAFDADPGWDALTYHLPLAERTAFANGSFVTPWSVFSAFPHAMSMLYLLTQTLDSTALARWLHLEFGVLTALLAVVLARTVSHRAGWLAAAALAACPLFAWELGIAYADLPACFFTLLAVALLRPRLGLARCAAAGLFAGAAAACRYPSWGVPVVLVALVWLPDTVRASRLRASLAVAAGALVPLAPWIVRNFAFTGNPFSPALQSFFAAPGAEFFAPLALTQNAAFIRAIGPGHGPLDLLALPWRLTVEAAPDDYRWFGYRVGPLYLLGVIAALGWGGGAKGSALVRRLWSAAGLSLLFWFFTAQDPRYLLPALVLAAVAGAIAADRAVGSRRLWLLLPILAVLHAQLPVWTALPQRYGTALGRLSVSDAPAARVGQRLRAELTSGDRVVLLFEPRAWFFRGLDYVPYHLGDGSPLLVAIHRARREGLDALFRDLGATHFVVNTRLGPQTTPYFVPAYSHDSFETDLAVLNEFLGRRTEFLFREGSLEVRRLRTAEPRS